ncbi:MAG: SpoIIE family protein phosphatase, partial [Clostridia bacterium]|nr:SpoIIE family protein phosphatase [Clostridia bacterium]
GMGTTVVACIAYNNKFYAANVGDSRLYMFDGRLNQVTKDHSFVRELIDMGLINEQQAKSHPNKNVITRAIGTDNNVTADIYSGKLNENDILMICTDGLTNMVSDDEIERILSSEKTLAEMTNILIDNAKTSGGRDNITIVCIKINDGGTNKI